MSADRDRLFLEQALAHFEHRCSCWQEVPQEPRARHTFQAARVQCRASVAVALEIAGDQIRNVLRVAIAKLQKRCTATVITKRHGPLRCGREPVRVDGENAWCDRHVTSKLPAEEVAE